MTTQAKNEKKMMLFEKVMKAQEGCKPIQFSIEVTDYDVRLTIHDACNNVLKRLTGSLWNEEYRIEVNNNHFQMIAW